MIAQSAKTVAQTEIYRKTKQYKKLITKRDVILLATSCNYLTLSTKQWSSCFICLLLSLNAVKCLYQCFFNRAISFWLRFNCFNRIKINKYDRNRIFREIILCSPKKITSIFFDIIFAHSSSIFNMWWYKRRGREAFCRCFARL